MGRTPPRARRRLTLAVVLFVISLLAVPAGPVATAKKGGNAGGNGQGAANGNSGQGGGSGSGDGAAAAPQPVSSPGGGPGGGGGYGGNGNGGNNGNGNGNGGNGKGGSAPQPPPPSSTPSSGNSSPAAAQPSSPSGSSGSSGSSGADAPVSAASASPTPAAPQPLSTRPSSISRKRAAERRSRTRTAARRRAARRSRSASREIAERRFAAYRSGGAVPGGAVAPGATGRSSDRTDKQRAADAGDESPIVVRTLRSVVEVIPGFVKAIIGALALALLIASAAWFLLARNARFLRRQREKLVGEIGVLQGALLPNVPPELSRLQASVAYRPAEGLAAGGDFYDAFPLEHGHVGIVVGDVAGHGKEALMHTALLRYTMRAYLEAGLEPRGALQVAGRVLDRGFDTLATVVLAVYDPDRRVLRYATAGHPPPVFLGEADHVPVTRASSPPIGAMLPTGLRQTTVSLPAGSAACFFTDGLIEARRDGDLIGRLGLVEIIRDLGPHATASQVLDRVAVVADHVGDDMAACMFRVSDGPSADESPPRVEELEIRGDEPVAHIARQFLSACGIAGSEIHRKITAAERTVASAGGAILTVAFQSTGPTVCVEPANVESFAAAQAVRAAV